MRSLSRTFLVLAALVLAVTLLPAMVMQAAGGASRAALADAVISAGGFDTHSTTAFQSPLPTVRPPGTVPPPPKPTPRPPRPAQPAPTAVPQTPSGQARIYPYKIEKVIGDRLSPTIYAITERNSLYRSDDDGRVWLQVRPLTKIDDFVMSSADPNVLYSGKGVDCADPAAANEPFYQSIDGGYYWEEMPAAMNLRPLLIDPADPYRLFAADCSMLYLSTDGGMSWDEMPDNSAAQLWTTFRVIDMAAAALIGDPAPEQPHWDQLYAIGIGPDGASVVAFSGDQGDTWVEITDPQQAAEVLGSIVAQLQQAGAVWTLSPDGVWATADFGIGWNLTRRGLGDVASLGLNDVTYTYNDKLILATDRGIYEKAIDGKIWEKTSGTAFGSEKIVSLLLTDSNPKVLWVNTEDEGVFTFQIKEDED